eukprot:5346984-Pyramimonas_sp.AAC.1
MQIFVDDLLLPTSTDGGTKGHRRLNGQRPGPGCRSDCYVAAVIVGRRSSVVGRRLSVVSFRSSVVGRRSSVVRRRSSSSSSSASLSSPPPSSS